MSKTAAALVIIVLAIVGFAQREALAHLLFQLANSGPVQSAVDLVSKDAFLPSPLRRGGADSAVVLTRAGVVKSTNEERAKFNLLPLHENAKLTKAAELKAKDMFDQQYFEHVSPDGKGPSDLADQVGYKYVVVGENLAEGHFKSDADLVQAWMDSPGHRANILHEGFQEIGVAVAKGTFEGKTVWMAVQSFGVPASACPGPSPADQSLISQSKAQIEVLKQRADGARARGDRNEYNAAVVELNSLIDQTQSLIQQYNSAVDNYNRCLKDKS